MWCSSARVLTFTLAVGAPIDLCYTARTTREGITPQNDFLGLHDVFNLVQGILHPRCGEENTNAIYLAS